MIRSQRFLMQPTTTQAGLFRKAAGVARHAWNWALALRTRHYRVYGKVPGHKSVASARLQKLWNRRKKRTQFAWVNEVSKHGPEQAFRTLDKAFAGFFAGTAKYPAFKSKHRAVPSFEAGRGSDAFRAIGRRLNVPRVGYVRASRLPRWPGVHPLTGRVKFVGGRWWLTLSYDLPDPPKISAGLPSCGIDLGCKVFATVSSQGVITDEIAPPKPYAKAKRKLRRAQRAVCRRHKGSKRRDKAKARVARIHARIASIRDTFLHGVSARLVKAHGRITLEDLSVKGMARGRLAKAVHDLGFGEFRRQVEYKGAAAGCEVVLADRFYQSSKTCSRCGVVKAKLPLKERVFRCDGCGFEADRDHNAAFNLEHVGPGGPNVKRPGRPEIRKARKGLPVPVAEPGSRRSSPGNF